MRLKGIEVGVYKPIETGCLEKNGCLIGADAELLREAAKSEQSHNEVCPQRFREPAAPLVAAEAEGRSVDIENIVQHVHKLSSRFDILLIEGAGGLLVPLTSDDTYGDLMQRLGIPVVVVVGAKLGCINHSLLTLEALKVRGIPVLGLILNELSPNPDESLAHQTHRELLERFTDCKDLVSFPYLEKSEQGDPNLLAFHAAQNIDLTQFY